MTPNSESMKKADLSRLDTLEALIAEKRKQETFLAKLQERRAGTPEHVFKRLEDEYITKLTDAQVKAAAEAESLSGGLEDDEAAVAEVLAKLEQLEEERVEMQLRADVEEWDAKETQKKLTAMNAAIAMAEKERDALTAVAERTRALLTEARGGTPAEGQAVVSGGTERAAMRPTTAAMSGGPNFDELAFLNSVVGRTSSTATPVVRDSKPAAQPTEAKEAASAPQPSAAPRSATPPLPGESVASPTVPPSPAPPPAAEKPPSEKPAAKSAEPAAAEPIVEDEDEEPSVLGRPTPRTSQAIKTLKCAECGSMNYPTEWYCERCGGELAAL